MCSVHLWSSLVFTARLALRSAGGFEYFMSQGKLDLSVELCFDCVTHSRSLIQTCLPVPLNEKRFFLRQMEKNRDYIPHLVMGETQKRLHETGVIPPVSFNQSR